MLLGKIKKIFKIESHKQKMTLSGFYVKFRSLKALNCKTLKFSKYQQINAGAVLNLTTDMLQ